MQLVLLRKVFLRFLEILSLGKDIEDSAEQPFNCNRQGFLGTWADWAYDVIPGKKEEDIFPQHSR